jgi:hypothetical protein
MLRPAPQNAMLATFANIRVSSFLEPYSVRADTSRKTQLASSRSEC